jgi:hypothetical protein
MRDSGLLECFEHLKKFKPDRTLRYYLLMDAINKKDKAKIEYWLKYQKEGNQ